MSDRDSLLIMITLFWILQLDIASINRRYSNIQTSCRMRYDHFWTI